MATEQLKAYADTSVFGGAFDEEFAEPTTAFFNQVAQGRFVLVSSALVHRELDPAPEVVRQLFERMLPSAELTEITTEALALQQAYLDAGIVSARHADDALHVAIAAVSRCSLVVSWNFTHIVHFDKIRLYNRVNAEMRLPPIGIHSPREVIEYEDQDL